MVCCVDSSMLLFETAEHWVFRQSLRICVLKISQNSKSHPKSLIINYIIIWINFKGFSCWSKHSVLNIELSFFFRHSIFILLIAFFRGMFCKLVFFRLQNMRWTTNVTWIINLNQSCLVKVAKATLHLWHPLTQCYKKGTPLIKNTTSQKWDPA